MSSTTRLLVLGVVKLFQPVHGYEVRRELISWRAQEWASVQPGSIYNALKTLTRDGLVEVASTDQVGGRPERTTYRLTAAGAEEFHTLLREEWWNVRMPVDPMMAAVSFLSEMSRAEAIEALEHRAAQIHGMVRHTEFAIEAHDGTESPYHVREMMRLMNARIAAELAWSQQFIARLRNHEYSTADDPPPAGPRAARSGGSDRGPPPPEPPRPRRTEQNRSRGKRAAAGAPSRAERGGRRGRAIRDDARRPEPPPARRDRRRGNGELGRAPSARVQRPDTTAADPKRTGSRRPRERSSASGEIGGQPRAAPATIDRRRGIPRQLPDTRGKRGRRWRARGSGPGAR